MQGRPDLLIVSLVLYMQEKKRLVKVSKKEAKPSSDDDKTKKQYPEHKSLHKYSIVCTMCSN